MKKLISLFVAGMLSMNVYADISTVKCKASSIQLSVDKSIKYNDNKVITFGVTNNKQIVFSDAIIEPNKGNLLTMYELDSSTVMSIRNIDIENVTKEKYYILNTILNTNGNLYPAMIFTCASIKFEK